MIKAYFYTENERSKESLTWAKRNGFGIFDMSKGLYGGPDGYPRALKDLWGKDDLIIMETDIVPTDRQLGELEECNAMACAFGFYGPWLGQIHLNFGKFLVQDGKITDTIRLNHLSYSFDFADFSGLGFCKLSKTAQKLIPPRIFDGKSWQGLDFLISENLFVKNLNWHIHKTFVKHNHFGDFEQAIE